MGGSSDSNFEAGSATNSGDSGAAPNLDTDSWGTTEVNPEPSLTEARNCLVAALENLHTREAAKRALGEIAVAAASLHLSEVQRRTWEMVAAGYSNGEMAKLEWVEESTVKLRLTNLYKKLGVETRHEAMMEFREMVGPTSQASEQDKQVFFTRWAHLTPRQKEVLTLAAEGYKNADIANELGVGVNCVKFHMSLAYSRMRVRNRSEAIQLFLENMSDPMDEKISMMKRHIAGAIVLGDEIMEYQRSQDKSRP